MADQQVEKVSLNKPYATFLMPDMMNMALLEIGLHKQINMTAPAGMKSCIQPNGSG